MELDIHGMTLLEAIDEIVYSLEECRTKGDNEMNIIHGFRHGKVLKDYVQSKGFIKEMKKAGFTLIRKESQNQGQSLFNIRNV
ncbi:MAG: hypothetical protein GF316_11625 [Candidatus Lokiarchaeota archaeon]|nr:hypothetical protein [Candidatus Lokiarchaeota archaeon]